jgi:phage-related protein (TIGR01555 family)
MSIKSKIVEIIKNELGLIPEEREMIPEEREIRLDSPWNNALTGMGDTTTDKLENYNPSAFSQISDIDLSNLFDQDWAAARIVSKIVVDSFSKGININTNETEMSPKQKQEEKKRILQVFKELRILEQTIMGLIFGRLYGGAALLLGTDQTADLGDPLDIDAVTELLHVTLFDKRELNIDSYYADPTLTNYGEPAFYSIFSTAKSVVKIHESHFVRFYGAPTSRSRRLEIGGWDLSVLQKAFCELQGFWSDRRSVHLMLTDCSQGVLKIGDFFQLIATKMREKFNERLALINRGRQNGRIMPIDKTENFEYIERSFQNIPELLEHGELSLSASGDMPVCVFMGRSPSGENATGEADYELWYGRVGAEREQKYLPILNDLLLLCARTADVQNPESWFVEFPELKVESEEEKAKRKKVIAETDEIYIRSDVLTPDEVTQERFAGEEYSDGPPQIDMDARAFLKIEQEEDGSPQRT